MVTYFQPFNWVSNFNFFYSVRKPFRTKNIVNMIWSFKFSLEIQSRFRFSTLLFTFVFMVKAFFE